MITREIKILKKVRHPNIIQLYQIIETNNDLYLIMEYSNAGELFDYIVKHGRVDNQNAAVFMKMLLNGVEYLHNNGVCHRDLKPENLLLERYTRHLKLIDFGLSNMYEGSQKLMTACGSPCYAAPEMIAGKPYNGLQVDIWSCGVILYAMVCGFLPFEDPDTNRLYSKIIKGQYSIPSDISKDARDLIEKILNTDPNQRYTMEQIRSHSWYVKNLAKADIQSMQAVALDLNIFTSSVDNDLTGSKELRINPDVVLEMAEKYKVPLNPTRSKSKETKQDSNLESDHLESLNKQDGLSSVQRLNEAMTIKIEDTLRDLANNKHNDLTTTYYLMHKAWTQKVLQNKDM